jgi:hypothetical protein
MTWKIASIVAVAAVFLVGKTLTESNPGRSAPISPEIADPQPVLLELFTSEGCSSCPPADAFLKQLDDTGLVDHVEVIAIEEHVDYWNRLGWTDRFSSHDWTERQERYARSFGRGGIYTPQLVVNGREELVGSAAGEARQKILDASKIPGARLRLSINSITPQSAVFSVAIESAPSKATHAEPWLAVTERGLSSNILRGENEGRNLSHAAVLRSLTRLGGPQTGSFAGAETTVLIPLDPAWKRENLRFVVFLQEPKTLHILGAAASSAPH